MWGMVTLRSAEPSGDWKFIRFSFSFQTLSINMTPAVIGAKVFTKRKKNAADSIP
jgi:hypothetical protein